MNDQTFLIHGDCIEEMKNLSEQSVDLILSDLPYGTTDRNGTEGKSKNRVLNWDCPIPLDSLWEQYKRVLKPSGCVVLTADQPFTSRLVMSNLEWFKYEWVWKKSKTTGFLHANARPMKETEDVLVFSPLGASGCSKASGKNMTYNPQGLVQKRVKKRNNSSRLGKFLHQPEHMGQGNVLLGNGEYEQLWTNYPSELIEFGLDSPTLHPTQKPVDLMKYMVLTYSNPEELVLDNCMGSGTTGVACKITGRRFIGIEKDEKYFEIAKKRIEEFVTVI